MKKMYLQVVKYSYNRFTMTTIISLKGAVKLLDQHRMTGRGRVFQVTFVKRTDGEIRVMNCRFNVKKYLRGGKPAYNFREKRLLCVCDMQIANKIATEIARTNSDVSKRKIAASIVAGKPRLSIKDYPSPYRSINLDGLKQVVVDKKKYVIV